MRDAEGARIPLFQRVTRDRKRKDEKGVDVDLKAGDIMQNSMVVPGRWWRVPQTLDTVTLDLVTTTAVSLREDNSQRQRDLGRSPVRQQSTGPSR